MSLVTPLYSFDLELSAVLLNFLPCDHLLRIFGRRLRAAGVSEEPRAELVRHKREPVTTHYPAPEAAKLVRAVELIAERRGPDADGVAVLKFRFGHKTPIAEKKKAAE